MAPSILSDKSLASPFWNAYTETMDRERIDAIHLRRLGRLLAWAYERVPFYRRLYDKTGIKPADIRTLEDFDRYVPAIDKKDVVEAQQEEPPWGSAVALPEDFNLFRFQTSGSTGVPLAIPFTYYSSVHYGEQWAYGFWAVGLRPRDTFYVAFNWGTFAGFWSAYWGIRRLGATVHSGGGLTTELRLKQIMEWKPTVLLATPTYALAMAEKARELGIDLAQSSVRVTYHAGEPGGNVPTTRRALEEAWGARTYELYGIAEVGAIAPGCPLQTGVHLAEDQSYATVVDPDSGKPVADGAVGENLVTSYIQFAQPVIKYRTHDLVRPVRRRCACGRTWMLFEGGVQGRTDHMIIIKGTNVYPTAVEALLGDVAGLASHYEVHVAAGRAGDELAVKVEAAPDVPAERYADIQRRAEAHLYERLLVRVGVQVQMPGALPRYELKAKRFFDHRRR
jgi:phenylacetate-CoA ligase